MLETASCAQRVLSVNGFRSRQVTGKARRAQPSVLENDSAEKPPALTRSALMARVRQRHTSLEMIVRRRLHALGYRFATQGRGLPGTPDIVFAARRKVVFVNGCFWHGHSCPMGRPPRSNTDYWLPKIEQNKQRDKQKIEALAVLGWSATTVWQCALKEDAGWLEGLATFLGPPALSSGDQ